MLERVTILAISFIHLPELKVTVFFSAPQVCSITPWTTGRRSNTCASRVITLSTPRFINFLCCQTIIDKSPNPPQASKCYDEIDHSVIPSSSWTKLDLQALQPFGAVGNYTCSLSELLNSSLEAVILEGDLDVRDSDSELFRTRKLNPFRMHWLGCHKLLRENLWPWRHC